MSRLRLSDRITIALVLRSLVLLLLGPEVLFEVAQAVENGETQQRGHDGGPGAAQTDHDADGRRHPDAGGGRETTRIELRYLEICERGRMELGWLCGEWMDQCRNM